MATPWGGLTTEGHELWEILATHRHLPREEGAMPWIAAELEAFVGNEVGKLTHGKDSLIGKLRATGKEVDEAVFQRLHPRTGTDYRHYMLEMAPKLALGPDDDWRTPNGVRRGMISLVEELLAAADHLGGTIFPIADHSCWNAQLIGYDQHDDSPRYRRLHEEALPAIEIGATRCGFQVHVENPGPLDDQYIRACRKIMDLLPLVVAATSSSYHPVTQVASMRYFHFSTIGSANFYGWRSLQHYKRMLESFIRDGRAEGPHDIHPWVKPCQSSVEIRCCDSLADVREMIAVAGILHTLVEVVFEMVYAGDCLPLMDYPGEYMRVAHATDMAARHGTFNLGLYMPNVFERATGGREKMDGQFDRLANLLEKKAYALGYGPEFQYFFHEMVGNQQSGHHRQKKGWNNFNDGLTVATNELAHLRKSINHARELFLPAPKLVVAVGGR